MSITSSRAWKVSSEASRPVAFGLEFGQFGADIGKGDKTDKGAPARNPALGFDDMAADVSTIRSKRSAWAAQVVDSASSRSGGRSRFEPTAEREKLARLLRGPGLGSEVSKDFGGNPDAIPDNDLPVTVDDQGPDSATALALASAKACRARPVFSASILPRSRISQMAEIMAAEMAPMTMAKLTTSSDESWKPSGWILGKSQRA
jgi:hypothetical protein